MDEQMIRLWWQIFVVNGMTEVRVLGDATYSGYFRNLDNLLDGIRRLNERNGQFYFVLNEISDDCYGRQQCEQFYKKPKQTTTDNDIVRRKWLMIDFDPIRTAGVSSTAEEFDKAHKLSRKVCKGLLNEGFPMPVACSSGNGWHLLYRIDMDSDSEATELIKEFLRTLSLRFGTDEVEIDEKVFNAARICKLYGTEARKGANIPERPWRMSEIKYVPETLNVLEKETIQAYIGKYGVKMEMPSQQPWNGQRFSLMEFMSRNGLTVHQTIHKGDRTIYKLERCPFDENHKNGDAAIFEGSNGALGFSCFHNSCNGKAWHDVRALFEPDYETRRQQNQQRDWTQRQPKQVQRKEPKEENTDDGKKWLEMRDIKRVDVENMPKVLTGFEDLDRLIKGLFMSELVILSGSSSAGKSSWINTLMLNIIEQNVKVALWSGELNPDILKNWIIKAAAGIHVEYNSNGDYYYVPKRTGDKIDEWIGDRMLIYNNNYGSEWEQVFSDMQYALGKGVQVFILDNLMTLDIDVTADGKYEAQKKVISDLKTFAKRNAVVVLMVAHPRKITSFIRKEDISGTGDITNIADDVFIIHRVTNDFYNRGKEYFGVKKIEQFAKLSEGNVILNTFDNGNVIEITKNRMYGVVDEFVGLYYDKNSRRFLGNEKGKICNDYGWYDGPRYTLPEPLPPPSFNNMDIMSPEGRELPFDQSKENEELPF